MFPNMGNLFPNANGNNITKGSYAAMISDALRSELGNFRRAIKTIMRWTGSNERTVRNWISGTNGPSGEHLVVLAGHSLAVMAAFQQLTGRGSIADRALLARHKLTEALALLDGLPRQ